MNSQEKLNQLETQLIFQEDIIENLNQTVSLLQQEIQLLKDQIRLIGQKMQSTQHSNVARLEEETPPPHY